MYFCQSDLYERYMFRWINAHNPSFNLIHCTGETPTARPYMYGLLPAFSGTSGQINGSQAEFRDTGSLSRY